MRYCRQKHYSCSKSPRIGGQVNFLGSELQIADSAFLELAYQPATSVPFGHLLIDLTTTCHDSLRFCTRICNFDSNHRGRHNYSLTSQEALPRKAGKFLNKISKTQSLPHGRRISTDELQLPTGFFVTKKSVVSVRSRNCVRRSRKQKLSSIWQTEEITTKYTIFYFILNGCNL